MAAIFGNGQELMSLQSWVASRDARRQPVSPKTRMRRGLGRGSGRALPSSRAHIAEAASRRGADVHGRRLAVEGDRRAGVLGDCPNARRAVGAELDPLGQDFRLGDLQRRKIKKKAQKGCKAARAGCGHLGIPPFENLKGGQPERIIQDTSIVQYRCRSHKCHARMTRRCQIVPVVGAA
jgi:hypothetical protein